ncbi:MAG: hypothetical protein JSV84_13690 [Gemmatimonadota bacterium]|nr:MAG: hypothetical protein JSV84_13690 [Gemmatimonadota bacterium]
MNSIPSKSRGSLIDRYATKSVAYELLLWLFFWGLYSLWAGYSPSYPKSHHSEPLFPLVVLGFMLTFFFIFGDRNEFKLLIANSTIALILVPGFLVLNIYRASTKQFPDAWAAAGILFSQYTFFFIQSIFLFLSIMLFRYTIRRWKLTDTSVRNRYYLAIAAIIAFFLFASALVLFFVLRVRGKSSGLDMYRQERRCEFCSME